MLFIFQKKLSSRNHASFNLTFFGFFWLFLTFSFFFIFLMIFRFFTCEIFAFTGKNRSLILFDFFWVFFPTELIKIRWNFFFNGIFADFYEKSEEKNSFAEFSICCDFVRNSEISWIWIQFGANLLQIAFFIEWISMIFICRMSLN